MRFNNHSYLEGRHAFLSPSSYHWLNYSDEYLKQRYVTSEAAKRGSELHAFAEEAIRLGIRLPRNQNTLNAYVNDAITYKMETEVPLFYSLNCFGTADTISFNRNLLRIHDLKTGKTTASEKQLMVYAAIFCLEYGFKPGEINYELRIYQQDEVRIYEPDGMDILHIMDRIVHLDRVLKEIQED